MKPMRHRTLTQAIERKVPVEFGSGSERTGWVKLNGQKLLRLTMPKIHRGDVADGTANSMRKQLHLTSADFEALYDCPFTAADFRAHLERLAEAG